MMEIGRGLALLFLFLQVVWISVIRCEEGDFQALEELLNAVLQDSTYNASEMSPCTWKPQSFSCSSNGRITSISLQSAGLTGEIPQDTLSNLTALQKLDLSGNNLTMSLTELSNLTNLQTLVFTGNTGKLVWYPDSISNLTQLEYLDLSWSKMNGLILQDVTKLTQLTILDLTRNQFFGKISGLFENLLSLEFVDLSSNGFDGLISLSSLCNLPSLETVNLGSNYFGGKLSNPPSNSSTQPSDLCSSLQSLDLSSNFLSGEIPSVIFQFHSLRLLYLQINYFDGSLSISDDEQGQNITLIELEANKLSGMIPEALLKIRSLKILKLGWNSFSGFESNATAFPATLEILDLQSNNLSGPIPPLDQGLLVLDLHNNKFTGNLPPELPQLKSLRYMDVSSNAFIGGFPMNISLLSNVQRISVASNNFSNFSLSQLFQRGDLTSLEYLDATGANLKGTIPSSIGKFNESLTVLMLSRNNLGGEIPLEISTLKKIALLDLSSNKLTSKIPNSIGNLNGSLMILNLSRNSLEGGIPPSLGNLKRLFSLDLSHNKLGGNIPINMTNLSGLTTLDLSYNSLNGEIPYVNQWLSMYPSSSFLNNTGLCSRYNLSSIPQCRNSTVPLPPPMNTSTTDDTPERPHNIISSKYYGKLVINIPWTWPHNQRTPRTGMCVAWAMRE
ncbi:hypothetical protein R1sor_026256 [Riccia sorocarpa]|uniref:Leucine-rich repeat-containing N-terminal plant-type domain-containing protein n=1 Tax=Riccia sorocarpa TaxID=122646 RepID=A0ABD3GAW5_9MARC